MTIRLVHQSIAIPSSGVLSSFSFYSCFSSSLGYGVAGSCEKNVSELQTDYRGDRTLTKHCHSIPPLGVAWVSLCCSAPRRVYRFRSTWKVEGISVAGSTESRKRDQHSRPNYGGALVM
ncbi:Piso0_003366 [Millerozyma farinosa CBS 7064]|uniref:Piso0_003366 protein n=1 Tax=Pichia sorbitophila (strain ATCC MYA-4447 / BCRC 22081 / CBS 7064 / NBRC 10061 / NRRL Y-12695) TaxID=559304 RepID=G8YHX5_PICSO|nr:Piso0_003366 [Millerozyma farinosa CBS 7064]CCE81027.1 Piso0_003366 [Millerozyma farinosa CBS 7064]